MDTEKLKTLLLEQYEDFQLKDLGVIREKLPEIRNYLLNPYAIVISGLRRSGKSTFLSQIANKYYKNDGYYCMNFDDERFLDFESKDFNQLYEILIELFGDRKVFFLDEIQNIKNWEAFVRRLIDQGFKLFITGSNASLLSKELGTRLTGRYLPMEILPFSFREYLTFVNINKDKIKAPFTTLNKGIIKKHFNAYLKYGGIPDCLKYPNLDIHKNLYQDIIYRDVASRYKIDAIKELRELSFNLISNIAKPISFNKIKNYLALGSVHTVKNFIDYLENSWLFFVIYIYSHSVKKQQILPKKVYSIDTGLINSIAFKISEDRGRLIENIVFLELKRKGQNVFYYKSENDFEVDFYIPEKNLLIQVSSSLDNEITKNREVNSMLEVMNELNIKESIILTESDKEDIRIKNKKILIRPLYEWLLEENISEENLSLKKTFKKILDKSIKKSKKSKLHSLNEFK